MMANTNYPSPDTPQNPNRPVKTTNNTTKNVIIGVLAAGLLGTWAYFLYDKNDSNRQIQDSKVAEVKAMTAQDSIKAMYDITLMRLDSITGDNNNKAAAISERDSKITDLKKQINSILAKRNATQAELNRAKSLIAELNNQIAQLEAENARLTGENQQLASNNEQLTAEKGVLESNLQTTTAEKEEMAATVDVASTFSASNIQITPVNEKSKGKEKTTTNAKKSRQTGGFFRR